VTSTKANAPPGVAGGIFFFFLFSFFILYSALAFREYNPLNTCDK
jgi:hypothetical protein